ncbi:uncharacterized protein LOC122311116 isoform X2 [Carya illinoinensis]|uniref:MAR-binding filament-like protein 1 n=1 Tax=Carya illinoinensis TaxID=32201 RepID=A0A8T1QDU2_CARIL|nr:uncharacterized protein LOC122311116 isoform X2 [Carya illinoinensis]KAG6652551.1 hypothetical protein CIPAW_05G013700 [Carya illinoinensis]
MAVLSELSRQERQIRGKRYAWSSLSLMATSPSSLLSCYFPLPLLRSSTHPQPPSLSFALSSPLRSLVNPRKLRSLVLASSSPSSAASFDDLFSKRPSRSTNSSKKSVLSNLIQEIEPLDVSLIQKDVPPTTVDAMKRTISGMLGLLPSDQFQVLIEALWEPLSKLLVSSMMTGYTLRNAEYRLCLERNLDMNEGIPEKQTLENAKLDLQGFLLGSVRIVKLSGEYKLPSKFDKLTGDSSENVDIQHLNEMSPEAQQYILHLQSRLSSVRKELCEIKGKSAALQMQKFVGEEKNDLLDYLRSLQPEKVAELSEAASPELKEIIYSVVHGLLATLSPKMHSKAPLSANSPTGTVNVGSEDCGEIVENASLQLQPLISLNRDYLARLLFWCMLLGHFLRGREYRTELMELLSLTSSAENDASSDGQAA